jgi:hypothetical protein
MPALRTILAARATRALVLLALGVCFAGNAWSIQPQPVRPAIGVPESYGRVILGRHLKGQGFTRRYASCEFTSSLPGRERWKCRWRGRKGSTVCRGNARVSNNYVPPATFRTSVRITWKRCVPD